MAKIKVHEIAKEFDIKSSEVIDILAQMGIEGKAPASGLEDDQAEALRKKLSQKSAPKAVEKAAEKPEQKPAAKPAEKSVAKPSAPVAKPAGGAPVKKKKPIIVVSSARNGQQGGRGGAQQGTRSGAGVRPGQRQGGIIRPTVPTTAERAARLAETSQGGDRDRIRKTGIAPKKESNENDKAAISAAGNVSSSNGSPAGDTGSAAKPQSQQQAPATSGTGTRKPAGGDRPVRNDNRPRGGIVINQGRGFNASSEPPKDNNNRRGGSDRKGNTSKDKNKKDRIFFY